MPAPSRSTRAPTCAVALANVFVAALSALLPLATLARPAVETTTTPTAAPASIPAATPPPLDPLVTLDDAELRAALPPWPAVGSFEDATDRLVVRMAQDQRTPALEAEAERDAARGPLAWADTALGPDWQADHRPQAAALLARVQDTARAAVRAANAAHPPRPRPRTRDGIAPSLASEQGAGTPHSSWPSARTVSLVLWSRTLSAIDPATTERLAAAAERGAWLRVVGGAHYPSDIAAGQRVADAVWRTLQRDAGFAAMLAEAQAEHAALGPRVRERADPADALLPEEWRDAMALFGGPPAADSAADLAERRSVALAQHLRSPALAEAARRLDAADFWGVVRLAMPAEAERWQAARWPAADAMLRAARADIEAALVEARANPDLQRPRPPRVDASLQPSLALPEGSGWPSAKVFSFHAQLALLVATRSADEGARLDAAVGALLRELGDSRVIAGVHAPGDVIAAERGADALAKAWLAEERAAGLIAAARTEADEKRPLYPSRAGASSP